MNWLLRFLMNLDKLQDTPDSGSEGVGDPDDQDILDAPDDADPDEAEVVPDEDENKDPDEDENEDKDKEEKEEVEEEEEDTERTTHVTDIKAKFPDFFKQFPDVKGALYREQRYSETFGSPEEAETAASRSEVLGKIEQDLFVSGNPVELLKVIQKESPDSYRKVAIGVLQHAQNEDQNLYYDLAAVPIKQLLRKAWKEGNGKETDLGRAAAYIHKFFFDNTEFEAKVPAEAAFKPAEKSRAEIEAERKLATIADRQYNDFKGAVDQSYVKRMDAYIREGLEKDDRLSEYMKNTIVTDIMRKIVTQVEQDKSYMSKMGSLFKQARNAEYASDFKSRIVSTALARAKSLVPSLRAKVIAEALGKGKTKPNGAGKVVTRERTNERRVTTKKPTGPLTDMDILQGRG
jgi:hypothetical protein